MSDIGQNGAAVLQNSKINMCRHRVFMQVWKVALLLLLWRFAEALNSFARAMAAIARRGCGQRGDGSCIHGREVEDE